ncbi:Bug family tripartite tricarboxylate transporter substrate binding protein [Muricoccus radiodurans]|uniref:Bug family tripartite tricarboxylate transporter substrate binding protein n=1 Tax=Muricoccus radiodurans TaxID=2231721 RepID=UPI003CF9836C
MRRDVLKAAGALALPAILSRPAEAQAWPNRPVRFIVPFPPGGASDVVSRLVTAHLSAAFNVPFVIDNRPGASTMLGAEAAARSAPDGHTLLMASTSTMAAVPALYGSRTPYNPLRDFVPVGLASLAPFFVFLATEGGFADLGDLVRQARARPGQLSYGSNGAGAASHLGMELLARAAGFEMLHVPYRSIVPALTDLVAKRLSTVMGDVTSVGGALQSGQLRLVAAASRERSPVAPEVPTVSEAIGIPPFDASPWFGIFAPTGVPEEVVARLGVELRRYLSTDAARQAFLNIGQVPLIATSDELRRRVEADSERFGTLIREQRITVE